MALDKELWLTTIQEQLFKSDEFLTAVGIDHGGYVNNKVVHIPQAGSNPTISKNLTTFPQAITERTDTDLTYNLDLYYSTPVRLGKDETQFISYDKRASILQSHLKKMRNVMGNNTLYKWANVTSAASSLQVITTGSSVNTAIAPSATGTRKKITLADVMNAASILDSQNLLPDDERYLIIPSAMYWQLISDTNILKALEWGDSPVAPSGKVPIIAGVKLLKRSSVLVFDASGTPVIKTTNDEGTPSSPASTDNMGALMVSSSYVSKALGEVDVFNNPGVAQYFGDIMSIMVAFGASQMRTNGEGIVSIIQTA